MRALLLLAVLGLADAAFLGLREVLQKPADAIRDRVQDRIEKGKEFIGRITGRGTTSSTTEAPIQNVTISISVDETSSVQPGEVQELCTEEEEQSIPESPEPVDGRSVIDAPYKPCPKGQKRDDFGNCNFVLRVDPILGIGTDEPETAETTTSKPLRRCKPLNKIQP